MSVIILWFLIVIASSALIWTLAFLLVARDEWVSLGILLASISSIAASAGIVGGLSRDGAAGDIVAAALGLLGGVVVYLSGIDRTKGVIASLCAATFSLSFVVAYFEAAVRRGAPESYVFWRDQCVSKLTDVAVVNDPTAATALNISFGRLCVELFKRENAILLGTL